MVKSVVGEETQLKSAEDRLFQSSVPAQVSFSSSLPRSLSPRAYLFFILDEDLGVLQQVGLIVGKLSSDSNRGFVYDLITTPPTDGGGPACSLRSEGGGRDDKKKVSKGGKPSAEPSLVIDGDWVAEHARQVSRMLLGGMNVVGIYIWASEASFKATTPSILAQAVRLVAQAASWYNSEFDESLLIHISYSPRRWTCRNCSLASGNLQPCDFKMSKLLASLQAFRCMYNFEIRLPIVHVGAVDSHTFRNVLCKGITYHAKELQSAKVLIDGNLVTDDLHSISEGFHEVKFLLPFKKDTSAEACSSEEVSGLVVFSGSVCASAYLGPREPISQAIADLKGDIITSLRSRLDIISDEAEGEAALAANSSIQASEDASAGKPIHQLILHELRKPCCLSFPRRVLVPWFAGIFICDYMQPSETFEDVKDRCKEMMSMESPVEASAIVEPETVAATATERSFWDVTHGDIASLMDGSKNGRHLTDKAGSGKSKGSSLNFPIAIFIILVAMLVGWAITVSERKNVAPW